MRLSIPKLSWTCALALYLLPGCLQPLYAAAPESARSWNTGEQFKPNQIITLHGDVFHVQGVDMDEQFIYVTSANKKTHRGFVHKFTRDGGFVAAADVTDGPRYHPGGFSLEGHSLWIPVAEDRSDSTTRVVQLDKETLTLISSFPVKDHIGALTVNGERLIGANWGTKRIYTWDRSGEALHVSSGTSNVRYQDMKFVDGDLVASGVMADNQSGAVDWLDPTTFEPKHRLWFGKMPNGVAWNREGMALNAGKLYLLPDDGQSGKVELYVFDLEDTKPMMLACTRTTGKFATCPVGRRTVALR